ncbi:MAG: hypothetical protein B6240_12155 [Desulfobacteraceae bacterium 4572_87]|nr:MAG: hypothetical protein B6240_12155 [Desulfobacteraceae bacterium 4572_87]
MNQSKNENRISKILVVDDSLTIRTQIKYLLEESQFEVILAKDGLECLEILEEDIPDVVLLDIIMPRMGGITTCRRIKEDERLQEIPVLILTNVADVENKVKGLNAGADDYITKPFDVEELIARVDSVVRSKRLLEQLKEEVGFRREVEKRLRETNEKLEKSSGELRERMLEAEQSKKIIEEKNRLLKALSTHDTLTGLNNRLQMDEVVKREFKRARRYGSDLSLLMFDLDFFKDINDSYGHDFGDFVLKEFASDLKRNVRDSDALFRYGGEEFLAVFPETSSNGAEKAAELLRGHCETRTYDFKGRSITATVSIGISSLQNHPSITSEEMLSHADKALYQAKAEGRNRVRVFRPGTSEPDQGQKKQGGNPLKSVKERLSAILEKTKDSSISSLELLVRDMGDARFSNHKKRVLRTMELLGGKLHLPPNIVDTFKRAASLHDCFCNILLGKSLIMNADLNPFETPQTRLFEMT